MRRRVARRDDSAGSPSRSAPTTSVSVRRARARAAARPARADERDRAARQLGDARDARTTGTAKIAPIDARTALGPYGSAVPGPSATLPAPNASAARSTVPTLPGSLTPHSATQSGPAGAGAQRCG